ncbi:hypothetical protein K440DRAFT_658861 [Wilcoxina mikolae CBS 423.85]|nr:hypothetical protein K440DRAFT_658861 [Wilcoxina mikolae CBS 423.85]
MTGWYYRDAAQNVKDIYNYQGVLKSDSWKWRKQNLRVYAVPFSRDLSPQSIWRVFLADGKLWEDDKFQQELRKHLRPNAVKSFTDAVTELLSSLKSLEGDIGLDKKREPALLDQRTRKRQWKKLKLILDQKSYTEVLDGINRINNDLKHLIVIGQLALNTPTRTQKVFVPKKYRRLRDYADNLYGIFSEKFRAECPCPVAHVASLPLQVTGPDQQSQNKLRLEVLFHFSIDGTTERGVHAPWKWHALESGPVLEPAQSASPTSPLSDTLGDNEAPQHSTNQDRIDDLCAVLKRSSEKRMNSCIGDRMKADCKTSISISNAHIGTLLSRVTEMMSYLKEDNIILNSYTVERLHQSGTVS